ncbi:hypothetical protein RV12_GL001978 [Enterococcus quebecensis]|nr:hypothetical protein RV12_GL001978 [Enterococcus quebecensis]
MLENDEYRVRKIPYFIDWKNHFVFELDKNNYKVSKYFYFQKEITVKT